MALAHHELGDIAGERQALESLVARDGDSTDALLRLIELGEEIEDWQCVADNALRFLAVNPLIVAPHRSLAKAAEELGQRNEAIRSYRALLNFDTTDPAHSHFRLAALLRDEGQLDEAKRQVLMALDEAPRYLAAHKLLLELTPNPTPGEAASAAGQPDDVAKVAEADEANEITPPPATPSGAEDKEPPQ
jgi:tetratricopeptide (TPR) repeat protein